MKWFKHYSDSYSNLKQQQVIAEFGLEGYGLFWVCVELVAQQGTLSRIKADKKWKKVVAYITHLSEEKIDKFLKYFSEVNLIDKKGLEIGDLYIPKLRDYSDEYTEKVRRMSRQGRDNVGLDKIRIDKNRREESNSKKFDEFWSEYPPTRKQDKQKCQKKFLAYEIEGVADLILKDVKERKVKHGDWVKDNGRYVPAPLVYLNNRRWEAPIVELQAFPIKSGGSTVLTS